MKLLEHVCQRETMAVFNAGGLNAMLTLVATNSATIHKASLTYQLFMFLNRDSFLHTLDLTLRSLQDTMHSAMSVVTRLCGKMEPTDPVLPKYAEQLGALLKHGDAKARTSTAHET